MSIAPVQHSLTLEQFLALPETTPASEFHHDQITQKPMPQGEHSRLQMKLSSAINQVAEERKLAYAFPELRCTFGGQSIIPDISVFRWHRIPREPSGRIANRFQTMPDWSIEILSPGQSQTQVLDNLLHCSQQGTELGWLMDCANETVLAIFSEQRVQLLRGDEPLPVLAELELSLTPNQVFAWLQL
jgi:Uma2 family endonuclease